MGELLRKLWSDSGYFLTVAKSVWDSTWFRAGFRGVVFVVAYYAWKKGYIDPELRTALQGGVLALPAGQRNEKPTPAGP